MYIELLDESPLTDIFPNETPRVCSSKLLAVKLMDVGSADIFTVVSKRAESVEFSTRSF